jgi:hypothetical protein
MRRYISLIILMFFLTIIVFHQFYMRNDSYRKYLDKEYQNIQQRNIELISQNDSLRDRLTLYDRKFIELNIQDSLLKVKSDTINRKLKDLKSQYEQALVRPWNWHNDSIRLYFTNF